MASEFEVIIEKGEDGSFVGSVVELPGCFSQAKSIDELMARMKEAIELYLECKKDIVPIKFVGIQKVWLDKKLNTSLTA